MSEKVIPTSGAVIFNEQGEVVLVEHGTGAGHLDGRFGLPAGMIEDAETALDAAVREVQEETGLVIPKDKFQKLPTIYSARIDVKSGIKDFSLEVFTTQIAGGGLKDSKEGKPKWVKLDALPQLTLLPNVLNAIKEAASLKRP